jgi:dethiobiotin synthetase
MTNADLAVRLELDLIIVAENRLGCIHQILATVLAAQSVGLAIHAVVLNQTRKELDSAQTSNQTLLAPFLAKLDPRIQIWKESFAPMPGVESTQS